MEWQYNDGGRVDSGFKGSPGDCVVRSVAIASELPYKEVYDALSHGCKTQRLTKKSTKMASARDGVNVKRKWFKDYMRSLGFTWVPLMSIGSGCKVHLHKDELPTTGHLVLNLSRHLTAYINGVLHDTYDCSRQGTRCVYGYYRKENAPS